MSEQGRERASRTGRGVVLAAVGAQALVVIILCIVVVGLPDAAPDSKSSAAAAGSTTAKIWAIAAGGLVCIALTLAAAASLARRLKRREAWLAAEIDRLGRAERREAATPPARGIETAGPQVAAALERTGRRLREQIDRLQARSSEQRIVHESISTGMIALDPEQRVLSVNRAAQQLLRLSESRSKGRLLREVIQEPELNRFVSGAMTADDANSIEFPLVSRSGMTVHVIGEPIRDERQTPMGLLLLLSDVTRVKRLESMRSDFAANVSHELRTPITNIQGYVETLLEVGVQDHEQTRKFLDTIQRNTQRLAQIIEDLLALARLEQPEGQPNVELQPTALRPLATAAAAPFDAERLAKDISIEIDVPEDLSANLNGPLIEQALGNLLSNAIRYSPPGTAVAIRAWMNGQNELTLAVSDQGPGIAPEHVPRLFERFYRVDKARSREMGGTGLGLAIVKHIANVHGGRAEVESKPGRGSTFWIIVPAGERAGE